MEKLKEMQESICVEAPFVTLSLVTIHLGMKEHVSYWCGFTCPHF